MTNTVIDTGTGVTDSSTGVIAEVIVPGLLTYGPVQFKMVSMCLANPTSAPSRLLGVSPALPLKQLHCSSDCMTMALSRPFKGDRRALAFSTPLFLQAIGGLTLFALCP